MSDTDAQKANATPEAMRRYSMAWRIERLEFELRELKRDLHVLAEMDIGDHPDQRETTVAVAHYARTLLLGHSTRFGLPGLPRREKIVAQYLARIRALDGGES